MEQETVWGPPGTGKTTTLIDRLTTWLGEGVGPQEVTYTSFTRVAAEVARDRALAKLGSGDEDDYQWFGTLHRLCGRLLGFNWRDKLLSESDRRGQMHLRQFGKAESFEFDFQSDIDLEADVFSDEIAEGNRLLAWFNWSRQHQYDIETGIAAWRAAGGGAGAGAALLPERQRRFADAYEEFKDDLGLSDFTDILERAEARGVRPPTTHLVVDEAQDLSPLQWAIIDRWRRASERVVLAGDDDQAIYAFQGADARLFLDRAREGSATLLTQSYRLPHASWAVATWLSSQIVERQTKTFAPLAREGSVSERPLFRIPFNTTTSWFVLVRNTRLLAPVRAHLEEQALPYTSRRGYDPVKLYYPSCRAITALAHGQALLRDDLAALIRHLEPGADFDPYLARRLTPARIRELPRSITQHDLEELGFSERFRARLTTEHEPVRMLHLVSARGYALTRTYTYLCRLARTYGDGVFSERPRIELSTIHGVKGDEADNVVLLTDCSRASLRSLDVDPDGEHRVWYVGATRARENLYIVPPATQTSYDRLTNSRWQLAMSGVR